MNYGFRCPDEVCPNKLQIYIMTPMAERPRCPTHKVHYVPDINWPPGVKVSTELIQPDRAMDLLKEAFESSFVGVDEQLVEKYTELMKNGEWVTISEEMGGAHYPIYFRDDRVLLGIQRLKACVQSSVPLLTVVVRTYGYY